MFKKLQLKWKVTGFDLLLILCTFAVGGSLCGFAGRKIMGFLNIDKGFIWVAVYIVILTIIWPVCVLLVSIFTGQYSFFKKYIGKIMSRIGGKKIHAEMEATPDPTFKQPVYVAPVGSKRQSVCNIAIFASGAGSNASRLIEHFKNRTKARVALIICNKPDAGVISIAKKAGIEVLLIERDRFLNGDGYVELLQQHQINLLVLAGFLWKIPATILHYFPGAVVNIHPALLPKYGGKGMYGAKVHAAVLANNEMESGISIHFVDEIYDHGATIFQASCPVNDNETPESLAAKIHLLEHEHYSRVVEELINAKYSLNQQAVISA